MENGTTKRCGVDFLKIAVPNKAKIKRVCQKKEKGKGRGKKSAGQENVQFLTKDESGKVVGAVWTDPPPIHEPYKKNQRALRPLREEQKKIEVEDKAAQDNDVLDIRINEEMFAGDKEEASNSKNNNNAKTMSKNKPAKEKTTTKEAKSQDIDDRRSYSFFPIPGTRKANTAAEEHHSRQINVHGLPNELTECQAGGVQDNALYDLFRRLRKRKIGSHGIDIKPHHIVGARPA